MKSGQVQLKRKFRHGVQCIMCICMYTLSMHSMYGEQGTLMYIEIREYHWKLIKPLAHKQISWETSVEDTTVFRELTVFIIMSYS